MARLARFRQLAPRDVNHTVWKGHNGEWIFKSDRHKEAYLKDMDELAADAGFNLFSFCIMNNHDHEIDQPDSVNDYSTLYHNLHSRHAQRYNKDMKRTGAVGNGRPFTTVVQDDEHFMTAMLYLDANPVRAGIVKHAKHYRWGSYNHYAYGKTGPGTKAIVHPDWYIRLGRTHKLRQKAYRCLFDAYLRREGMLPKPGMSGIHYYGDDEWVESRRLRAKQQVWKPQPTPTGDTPTGDDADLDTS